VKLFNNYSRTLKVEVGDVGLPFTLLHQMFRKFLSLLKYMWVLEVCNCYVSFSDRNLLCPLPGLPLDKEGTQKIL